MNEHNRAQIIDQLLIQICDMIFLIGIDGNQSLCFQLR